MLYKGGFALWLIHGVRVTEQIVLHPETMTVEQINAESNEEVRRVMIERFTWERYIRETNAQRIDKRLNERDGQWEELFKLQDGTHRIILVDPSTGRKYALGVPTEITTCRDA